VGIATAAHVVDQSHDWGEPIRIHHAASGPPVLLPATHRAILLDEKKDTATIVLSSAGLSLPSLPSLPDTPLDLVPPSGYLRIGVEIGWLGYPAAVSTALCFFRGTISAWLGDEYLVDGVAINGVSGGPGFVVGTNSVPYLMGLVSAYIPNRARGETLPGLSVVRDLSHLHDTLQALKSLEEAKKKETVGVSGIPSGEAVPTPKLS